MSAEGAKPNGDAPESQESPTVNHNITEFRRHEMGVSEIYANFINISWTLFDVRIRLAQVVPTAMKIKADEQKGFVAEEHAALTLAWPEAKILRDMLTDAVQRYEKANGELRPLKLAE